MARNTQLRPLDPIFQEDTRYGSVAVGNTPPGLLGLTFTYTVAGAMNWYVPDGVTAISVDETGNGGIIHNETVTPQTYYPFTVNMSGTVIIGMLQSTAIWDYSQFENSGDGEWWKAPDQAVTIRVSMAAGSGATRGGSTGGLGCEIIADYTPTPATDWAVWVGGAGALPAGGAPGGGVGGIANNNGSGGGGLSSLQPATDRTNHTVDLPNAIVVAGAGGGGSDAFFHTGVGGNGGLSAGGDGDPAPGAWAGEGATSGAGGWGYGGGVADGSAGTGGDGPNIGASPSAEGGGGGAGWYGGGAGGIDIACGGGGGGSSYVDGAATLISSTDGANSGAGYVTIEIS